MKHRKVIVSDEALFQLASITSASDYASIKKTLKNLEIIPLAYSVYDSAYEAARLPIECRVAYAGHYGIYFEATEDESSPIRVFAIVDQRCDPLTRFE